MASGLLMCPLGASLVLLAMTEGVAVAEGRDGGVWIAASLALLAMTAGRDVDGCCGGAGYYGGFATSSALPGFIAHWAMKPLKGEGFGAARGQKGIACAAMLCHCERSAAIQKLKQG